MKPFNPLFNPLISLSVAFLFSALFVALSVPLGEMFGGIVALVLLSKAGLQPSMPAKTMMGVQLVIGLGVGGLIPASFFETGFPVAMLAGLVLCMILQVSIGFWFLHYKRAWSKSDSLLASIPGAMAAILVLNEEQAKPSPKVVFVHTLRLVSLILLSGLLVSQQATTDVLELGQGQMNWPALVAAFVLAWLLGNVLKGFGFPAPYMVTSMVVSITFNLQWPEWNFYMPAELVLMAISALGAVTGMRMSTISLSELRQYVSAGFWVVFLSLSVTIISAACFSLFIEQSFLVLLIAWVPGSIEAMTVAALYIGLEPILIISSHVIRMMLLHTVSISFSVYKRFQPD